jgi:uncharacterized protein YjbI with pentapeptide repeats
MTHGPSDGLNQAESAVQRRRSVRSWRGLRTSFQVFLPKVRVEAWTISLVALLALGVLTVAVAFRLVWTPAWQLAGAESMVEIAQRVNDYRLALGPIFVGMLQGLAGGAILYGFWLNVREHEFSRLQNRQQRLKDAVLQLESERGATRLAALLELESVAIEDPRQLERIIDVVEVHLQTAVRPSDDLYWSSPAPLRTLESDVVGAFRILGRLGQGRARPVTLRLDLSHVDFTGVSLDGLRFDGSDFSGSVFIGGRFPTAPRGKFRRARFEGVSLMGRGPGYGERDLDHADFTDAEFHTCTIILASLRFAVFDGALFTAKTSLDGDLTCASLRNARFVDAHFHGRQMREAELDGATFVQSQLMYGVSFEQCKSQPANYPDGYVYVAGRSTPRN